MDKCVKKILKKIDGTVLTDHKLLKGKVATTENIIMALWPLAEKMVLEELSPDKASGRNVKISEITIQETARNYFTYKGEANE